MRFRVALIVLVAFIAGFVIGGTIVTAQSQEPTKPLKYQVIEPYQIGPGGKEVHITRVLNEASQDGWIFVQAVSAQRSALNGMDVYLIFRNR